MYWLPRFFIKLSSSEWVVHVGMAAILLNSSKLLPRRSSCREIRLTMHKVINGEKIERKKATDFKK